MHSHCPSTEGQAHLSLQRGFPDKGRGWQEENPVGSSYHVTVLPYITTQLWKLPSEVRGHWHVGWRYSFQLIGHDLFNYPWHKRQLQHLRTYHRLTKCPLIQYYIIQESYGDVSTQTHHNINPMGLIFCGPFPPTTWWIQSAAPEKRPLGCSCNLWSSDILSTLSVSLLHFFSSSLSLP